MTNLVLNLSCDPLQGFEPTGSFAESSLVPGDTCNAREYFDFWAWKSILNVLSNDSLCRLQKYSSEKTLSPCKAILKLSPLILTASGGVWTKEKDNWAAKLFGVRHLKAALQKRCGSGTGVQHHRYCSVIHHRVCVLNCKLAQMVLLSQDSDCDRLRFLRTHTQNAASLHFLIKADGEGGREIEWDARVVNFCKRSKNNTLEKAPESKDLFFLSLCKACRIFQWRWPSQVNSGLKFVYVSVSLHLPDMTCK